MATYDLTTTTPNKLKTGDIINCPYSGSAKSITLPKGEYKLEVWGAQGGYRSDATSGGKGGYSIGTINLNGDTTVYFYSGGSGQTGKTSGGFNGGGIRASYNGGGGGSDIRIGSDSLYARVIVAGGGGSDGAGGTRGGGYGGGTEGQNRTENFASYTQCGYGGGQTYSGYSAAYTTTSQSSSNWYGGFGFGGSGIYASSGYGGAGGGGWYGGSGTYPDGSGDDDRGGGGGSGYVYTSETAANYPSGCLLNSSYYLADTQTIAGNTAFTSPTGTTETGHAGDGYCRITVLNVQSITPTFVKVNNAWKPATAVYTKVNGVWKEATQIGVRKSDWKI